MVGKECRSDNSAVAFVWAFVPDGVFYVVKVSSADGSKSITLATDSTN
jgi:hypothetical protein